jgi:hypothetical protein
MGFEEIAASAFGAFGLAEGITSAGKKNKAAKRSAESARRSAEIQTQQQIAQADQDKRRQRSEQRRVQAAVLASSAESGFDATSQDIDSILSGYRITTQDATDTIEKNLDAGLALINSQLDSGLAVADSQKQSSLFSGFSGALGGVTSALTLINAADSFSQPDEPKLPGAKK